MTTPRRTRKKYAPPRSIRVSDEVWEKVKRRAEYEGTNPSYVANVFLEGYAKGLINLPTVSIDYNSSLQHPPAGSAEPAETP